MCIIACTGLFFRRKEALTAVIALSYKTRPWDLQKSAAQLVVDQRQSYKFFRRIEAEKRAVSGNVNGSLGAGL